jgi:hypothetical protein
MTSALIHIPKRSILFTKPNRTFFQKYVNDGILPADWGKSGNAWQGTSLME